MTKGQLNKYIEELKIGAVKKVKEDCEAKRNYRKLEIMENLDMGYELERIKKGMQKSIEELKEMKAATGFSGDTNGNYGFIAKLGYLISDLEPNQFLYREEILDKDPQTKAFFELEKQSIKAVTENYDTLRENCKLYPTAADAIGYLNILGFTVPDFETPNKLMKPLDTRFLIMKGDVVNETQEGN